MQSNLRVIRAMIESLDAKRRSETLKDAILQSVPYYFREHLTARYATGGAVKTDILRTDLVRNTGEREFTEA